MMSSENPQVHHTLGNEEIHVQYRNRQEFVREAIAYAQSLTGDSGSTAAQISLPVRSFRSVVEALRLTYKTLGETIHQDFRAQTDRGPLQVGDRGQEDVSASADTETESEAMRRFNAINPLALAALQHADRFSEANENHVRKGDEITVPRQAFAEITTGLVQVNGLMETVLMDAKMLGSESGITGPPPDRGDYGAGWDPWNTGDWARD